MPGYAFIIVVIIKNDGLSWRLNKMMDLETSLVAQWLRLWDPNAGGLGLIPGQGTRSHMHATTKTRLNKEKKKKRWWI